MTILSGYKFCMTLFALCFSSMTLAAKNLAGDAKTTAITFEHLVDWSIALVIVLCLFFTCVWLVRKTGALPIQTKDNLKIVSALSLGVREKLILVQVGEKQLLLGVTPNRIENLLILEGQDQLQKHIENQQNASFSDSLKQMVSGAKDE